MHRGIVLQASRAHQPVLMQLRRSRRRFAAWLALCAYLVVGAIVPPGHMAAALASGTAFHLCPGDLRSAQLLRALADSPATGHHPSGHDTRAQTHHDRGAAPPAAGPHGAHPVTHAADAGSDPGGHGLHGVLAEALDNDAADAGCTLASGAGAAVDALPSESAEPRQPASLFPSSRRVSALAARWLRPPVRSPPL
jgi:hypothetical protein